MNLNCPINSVSFGQVSFNILKELQKRNIDLSLFPIGKIDTSSYTIDNEFLNYLNDAASNARDLFSVEEKGLKIWHISGLAENISKKRCALTFHETNRLTQTEQNILNNMDVVFVTSNFTKSVFESFNLKCKIVYCPLGLDETHIKKIEVKTYEDDSIVFGLFGKMEKRKSTLRVLRAWARKYGDNKKYKLHAAITNPFLSTDVQRQAIASSLGKNFFNINFLPFVSKNSQYNEILNSIDIDLTGMSLCEGFNLPAFQCLCLGKQGIFLNAHVHKDYAKDGGAILVEEKGKTPAEDGLFFKNGEKFNQGEWSDFNEDEFVAAMEYAETLAKTNNTQGERLVEKFNYKSTTNILLENL